MPSQGPTARNSAESARRGTAATFRVACVTMFTLLALMGARRQAGATPLFGPRMEFRTEPNPYGIASADFNVDGIPDLVVANYGPYVGRTATVFLGNGDGTFRQSASLSVSDYAPNFLEAGDLNEDGRPDVVVQTSTTISVFLQNGNGTFASAVVYVPGGGMIDVDIADINHDGHLDVIAAGYSNYTPATQTYDWATFAWLGNGTGTFPAPVVETSYGSWAIAIGDLNGDTFPDLVVTNFYASWYQGASGAVSVRLGQANGSLGSLVSYSVPKDPYNVTVGDVNGDGDLDILTANFRDNTVSILIGNGDGTFQNHVEIATHSEADCVAVADMTGDGISDVITNGGGGVLSVFPGTGGGAFGARLDFDALPAFPIFFVARDLNGDSRIDVALTNYSATAVSIFMNTGCNPLQNGITGVFPARGGAGGDMALSLYGCGFQPGAAVKLSRAGYPDIAGSQETLSPEGVLEAKVHLAGAAQGSWDVVVQNPDNGTATLAGGFTVEAPHDPSYWVRTFGRNRNRVGKNYFDVIAAGNNGNYQFDPLAFVLIDNQSCAVPGELRWVYNGVECDIGPFASPNSGLFTLPGNLASPFSAEPIYTINGHVTGNADCCEPGCQPENSKVTTTVFQALGANATGAVIADQNEGVSEGLIYRFWKEVCTAPRPQWPSRVINIPSTIRHIWGSSATDVFAVGLSNAIWHRDGSNWTRMPLPNCPQVDLFGVWGRGPTDVYAVGSQGTILHYDGICWNREAVPANVATTRFLGVWGDLTSNNVFVVGNGGTILRRNGSGPWAADPCPLQPTTMNNLHAIWGFDGGPVYAVGANGTIYQLTSQVCGGWQAMSVPGLPSGIFLNGVWGPSPTDLIAVGSQGTVLRLTGGTWTYATPTSAWLYGVWGSGPNDVYAVGNVGTILHWDGSAWTTQTGLLTNPPVTAKWLFAVWGTAANNVRVMGDGSITGGLHYASDVSPIAWHTDQFTSASEDWYGDLQFPADLNAAVNAAYNQLQAEFAAAPCANGSPPPLASPDELVLQAVDRALTSLQGQYVNDVARYRAIFDTIWLPSTEATHRAQFRTSFQDLARSLLACPPIRTDWSIESTAAERICASSCDPNAKVGPRGIGTGGYVLENTPLTYTVYFENLDTATLAAAEVTVTDQLDPAKLDLTTFSFGPITFGSRFVAPPPGLSRYQTDVDLRPDLDLKVRIVAQLNTTTGLLTTRFLSLDPTTGLDPDDPTLGFLPPNVNSPEGEGSVSFTVMPRSTLMDGTVTSNGATIVFDTNAPIVTNEWVNTIDTSKPSSQVSTLGLVPGEETRIAAQWSGTDGMGAGIQDYSIYVSDNGGPYTLWRTTSAEQDTFPGEYGHSYGFYSVARDLVGHMENPPFPLAPDATIATNQTSSFLSVPGSVTLTEGSTLSLAASSSDPDVGQPLTVSASGFPQTITLTPRSSIMPDTTTASLFGILGEHDGDSNPTVYTITWVASDGVASTSATTQLTVYELVTGVEADPKLEFALRPLTPNPMQQRLTIAFSLPDARPARMEVFDVAGRLVAAREVGAMGAGAHTITVGERATLPSGVYIVRLSQGGKSLKTRAVVVR